MSDMSDYNTVMLAKLIDALLRKDTERDGNWGYPSFGDELREMQASIHATKAVKKSALVVQAGVTSYKSARAATPNLLTILKNAPKSFYHWCGAPTK